ncbi:sulfatase family protein [Sulfuriroseicoccus oceanibius]|uniref:Sulfatase n=1 Tax=Sulfuriroseicoccus oceanibius TaxID=2707525 RepID=A0A7T7F184_9BACT|nr:sulfatase [Sulfuriroseicoccus oceanibius]QQL44764.1 sulfatase [Sulfuriroseicoccus oceanibius]
MMKIGRILSLMLFVPLAAIAEAEQKKPNILFIFSDDHATAAIGAYGSKINETPNIDRLADEGALFENCHVTNAICGPSRACILTGLHSHKNGKKTNQHRFEVQPTFAKALREQAGYKTAIIGKWHLGDGINLTDLGFDHWMVYTGQGQYYKARYRHADPQDPKRSKITEFDGAYAPEKTTDLAIEWMRENRDGPFLMMCQFKAPHRHWGAGPKYHSLYENVTIPEPPTLFDDYSLGNRNSAMKRNRMSIARHLNHGDLKLSEPPYEWNRMNAAQQEDWLAAYGPRNQKFFEAKLEGKELVSWKYQRYIKDYLRCVAAVDDSIGRLDQFLKEAGLYENTVVVYSSDQGFFLGEHGWYDKRWMYEECLRMPLIIRWPEAFKGERSIEALVQNTDFGPTFLEMAGLKKLDGMQGDSFLPVLQGKADKLRDVSYYHYYESPSEHGVPAHFGIRTASMKLIRYYAFGDEKMDEWELFDLEKDPQELTNVFEDPRYAQVRDAMIAKLKAERERLDVNIGDMGEWE